LHKEIRVWVGAGFAPQPTLNGSIFLLIPYGVDVRVADVPEPTAGETRFRIRDAAAGLKEDDGEPRDG
jgi:hypothetical protein